MKYLILLLTLASISCSEIKDERYRIKKGEFVAGLTETGYLAAVNSRALVMPHIGWRYGRSFQIVKMKDHGEEVKAGETVIWMDDSRVQSYIIERQTRLEMETANLKKMLVQQTVDKERLLGELEREQLNFNLKKLELQKMEFEPEKNQQIKKLEFEKAQIALDRVKRKIELNEIIAESNRKIQEIRILDDKSRLRDAYRALEMFQIQTPISGLFQIAEDRRSDQMYKVGDEINQGSQIALVPDLSEMKVMGTINEVDISKVEVGEKVLIRLDAFPSESYEAEIAHIGRLSYPREENSNIRVFDMEIFLKETDSKLKPGMTVSCEIQYDIREDVFYVENECVLSEESKSYVFTGQGENDKREVEVVERNKEYTVISADFVEEGIKVLPLRQVAMLQKEPV